MKKKIQEDINKILYLYRLKKTFRWGDNSGIGDTESVAEHIFGMMILINHFLPIVDPNEIMDRKKIYEMVLFHDIDEIETGDIDTYVKTEFDKIKAKKSLENIFLNTPESFLEIMRLRYHEYEKRETKESKFVKAIDKIESTFHSCFNIDSLKKSMKRSGTSIEEMKFNTLEKTKEFFEIQEYVEPLFEIIKNKLKNYKNN